MSQGFFLLLLSFVCKHCARERGREKKCSNFSGEGCTLKCDWPLLCSDCEEGRRDRASGESSFTVLKRGHVLLVSFVSTSGTVKGRIQEEGRSVTGCNVLLSSGCHLDVRKCISRLQQEGGVKMQLSQMRGGVDKIPQQVEDEPGVMIGTPLFRE